MGVRRERVVVLVLSEDCPTPACAGVGYGSVEDACVAYPLPTVGRRGVGLERPGGQE